jgi:hypothetical protein
MSIIEYKNVHSSAGVPPIHAWSYRFEKALISNI